MNEKHIKKIADELGLSPKQVVATVHLLEEGATVPFIARYRKEATGSLDEVAITSMAMCPFYHILSPITMQGRGPRPRRYDASY